MKLREITVLLGGEIIAGADRVDGIEVDRCFVADLMSDVLARSHNKGMLITGLASIQAVRTADIADIKAICLVRGKRPEAAAVALAKEKDIPFFITKYTMFESCGILYAKGLRPVEE